MLGAFFFGVAFAPASGGALLADPSGKFCNECGAPRSNPSEESPVETWTDDETAFERTAKEELVGEDEEGIDTDLGMVDAEDETEYLMPFPEDEASA